MTSAFAFALLLGQKPNLAGTYITRTFDSSGQNVEFNGGPGAVRFLTLGKDRKWVWRDMLVRFDGTYSVSGNAVKLLALSGASGKLKKPYTLTLRIENSGKRLRLVSPTKAGFTTVFDNDPAAIRRVGEEYRSRMAKVRAELKRRGIKLPKH